MLQQDRLIGAGGAGEYARDPGLGRPARSTATPCSCAAGSTPTASERLDLGLDRAALRIGLALPGGATLLFAVTHLHHLGAGEAERDVQAAALLDWLDAAPPPTPRSSSGDFNADPAEPAYARMAAAGFRSALPRGQRQRAGRHLAVRAPGAGDGHRRRPGVPRLHLGPRRGGRRRLPARLRPPAVDDPTLYPSDHFGLAAAAPDRLSGRARTLRLAHRGDWRHAPENSDRRAAGGQLAVPGCDGVEFDVRASSRRRPGPPPRPDPRTRPGPSRGASASLRCGDARGARDPAPRGRPRGAPAPGVPRRRAQGALRSTARSRSSPPAAARSLLERGRVGLRPGDDRPASATSRRAGRAGSTPMT